MGAFFYFVYEEIREKPEFLPPQERWQIIDSYRDHVTIKYIGENTAIDVWASTNSYDSSSIASSDMYYFDPHIDLGIFQKGETFTFEIDGWISSFTIRWRTYGNRTLSRAKFEGLIG